MGAWIEMPVGIHLRMPVLVAPHMGAWIEILSPLVKPSCIFVAPHMGAWIEMDKSCSLNQTEKSHPTWVRGLKLTTTNINFCMIESHPTWVRGLKYKEGECQL